MAATVWQTGCQNTDDVLKPGDVPIDILTATFVPDSVFAENPIELNGEAIEREWGGPLDEDLPYFQIRVSSEDGEGEPGDPRYVSAKVVYTESDIYFLFRWTDPQSDVYKDALFYNGPSYVTGSLCFPPLADPDNWSFDGTIPQVDDAQDPDPVHDEDRFVVQFEIPDDSESGAVSGRRDVWQWLSTRTNLTRNLYSPDENPNFPARGTPGYLEDGVFDPDFGFFFDPGTPTWRRNFEPGIPLPDIIYRQSDDVFFEPDEPSNCQNSFGADCVVNNGLSPYYIWREDLRNTVEAFSACDSINYAPVVDAEPRPFQTGDFVSGYWYTYPLGSRADVRGKGVWDQGLYTLEVGRPLSTGDAANDLAFTAEPGDRVPFTIQVYDNSGTVYWGSGVNYLEFGEKDVGLLRTAAEGEES